MRFPILTDEQIGQELARACTESRRAQRPVVLMTGHLRAYGGLLCQRVFLVQPDGLTTECGMPVAVNSAPTLGDLAQIR